MEKTKILFVSQEIMPYLPESDMSKIGRNLPQGIQEKGREIRTFMPKYGCINERRNQLHEVIRLSGMNLIIDDTDHPLLIKVASIQSARMQVYFIDNEDFFQRKQTLTDTDGNQFKDNDERAIFFARGVLETVKKLRWSPDIVHCQGWITSLVPLYLKRAFNEDPLYANSKVIYSVYDDEFKEPLNDSFKTKLMVDGVLPEDINMLDNPTFAKITQMAINQSDGVIFGSENINSDVKAFTKETGLPTLEFQGDEQYIDAYSVFYDKIMAESSVKIK